MDCSRRDLFATTASVVSPDRRAFPNPAAPSRRSPDTKSRTRRRLPTMWGARGEGDGIFQATRYHLAACALCMGSSAMTMRTVPDQIKQRDCERSRCRSRYGERTEAARRNCSVRIRTPPGIRPRHRRSAIPISLDAIKLVMAPKMKVCRGAEAQQSGADEPRP